MWPALWHTGSNTSSQQERQRSKRQAVSLEVFHSASPRFRLAQRKRCDAARRAGLHVANPICENCCKPNCTHPHFLHHFSSCDAASPGRSRRAGRPAQASGFGRATMNTGNDEHMLRSCAKNDASTTISSRTQDARSGYRSDPPRTRHKDIGKSDCGTRARRHPATRAVRMNSARNLFQKSPPSTKKLATSIRSPSTCASHIFGRSPGHIASM